MPKGEKRTNKASTLFVQIYSEVIANLKRGYSSEQ
jgi:hypothetical protein